MICESCFETKVTVQVVVDDNMETDLCRKCIKAIRAEGMKVETNK